MKNNVQFPPAVFHGLLLASGAAALVFQCLWLRQFTIVLGNSLLSAVATTVALMLGLAAGAWAFGRLTRSRGDLLLCFALLQAGIALTGLCAGLAIPLTGQTAARLSGSLSERPLLDGFMIFALALAVLPVPTALIGGTLPVTARYVIRDPEHSGRRIGALCGWLAAGASTGCLLTGFRLLQLTGAQRALMVAAGINLLVCIAALVLRAWTRTETVPAQENPEQISPPRAPVSGRWFLLVAAGVNGAALFACVPVWKRLQDCIFINDAHIEHLTLPVVLAGIGLGGLLYSRIPAHRLVSVSALAWLETGLGLSIAVCYLLATGHHADPGSGLAIERLQDLFPGPIALRLIYGAALMFLPALLWGITFPLACRLYYHEKSGIGMDTGVILAAGALGASAGAFLSGLLLIPRLGLQWCLFLASASVLALGVWLMLFAAESRLSIAGKAALAASVALFLALALLPGNRLPAVVLKDRAHHEVLFYREGLTGNVMVTRDRFNGLRNLFINAEGGAHDSFGGMRTFKLLGHLPFLLHNGNPQNVLIFGCEAGIAAGAAAAHPVSALHLAEPEPAVIEASRLFSDRNRGVLDDPRVRIHLEDGRRFLHAASREFDIIVFGAVHRGSSGSRQLNTVEFYGLCRDRLAPGGVMAQLLPLRTGTPESYNAVLGAFQTAFPHTSVWFSGDHALLVGLPARLEVSWPGLRQRMSDPALRADLEPWCLAQPIQLVDCFLMDEGAARRMSSAARPNTDDRPFHQPDAAAGRDGPERILAMLERYRERESVFLRGVDSTLAPALGDSLESRFQAEHYLLAGDYLPAREILPEECSTREYVEEYLREPEYLTQVAAANPASFHVQLRAAVALTGHGEYDRAREIFRRMAIRYPDEPSIYMNIGNLSLRAGEPDSAVAAYRAALVQGRRDSRLMGKLGEALLRADKTQEALVALLEAVELDPLNEDALFHLGYAHNRTGSPDKGIAAYETLVSLNPNLPNARVNLGYLYLGKKRDSKARETFRAAVNLLPDSFQGWYGLGVSCLRLEDLDCALEAFTKALELSPGDPEIEGILVRLRQIRTQDN